MQESPVDICVGSNCFRVVVSDRRPIPGSKHTAQGCDNSLPYCVRSYRISWIFHAVRKSAKSDLVISVANALGTKAVIPFHASADTRTSEHV